MTTDGLWHSFIIIHRFIQVHDHWMWKSSVVYINILHKICPNIRYLTIKVYIQELINVDETTNYNYWETPRSNLLFLSIYSSTEQKEFSIRNFLIYI
jgi:hypothetical protein